MSNPVIKDEVEGVLSSIRRLVGESTTAASENSDADMSDIFVLTPQLRVAGSGDVLRLMPEDAVSFAAPWPGFDEQATPFVHHDSIDVTSSHQGSGRRETVTPQQEHRDASELSAKIAALETAIARTVGEWEPDDTGGDAYAGTRPPAMAWREDLELDGHGAPLSMSEFAANTAPEADDDVEAHTQILDEDTLRDMVAQLVRQEFQGELGERITRNVRKLVRQEIQRALASRSA